MDVFKLFGLVTFFQLGFALSDRRMQLHYVNTKNTSNLNEHIFHNNSIQYKKEVVRLTNIIKTFVDDTLNGTYPDCTCQYQNNGMLWYEPVQNTYKVVMWFHIATDDNTNCSTNWIERLTNEFLHETPIYHEIDKKYSYGFTRVDNTCKQTTSHLELEIDGFDVVWHPSIANSSINSICNTPNVFNARHYAVRKCLMSGWSEHIDYSRCKTSGFYERLNLKHLVKKVVNERKSLSPNEIHGLTVLLEKLSIKVGRSSSTSRSLNVLSTINKLLDCCHPASNFSARTMSSFRKDLDTVAFHTPIHNGYFRFQSNNIAMTVLSLSTSDLRHVMFPERISVTIKLTDRSEYAIVEIPMKAIALGLPDAQQQNLTRLAVILFNDSRVFGDPQGPWQSLIGSEVISVSLPGMTIEKLAENINVTYRHNIMFGISSKRKPLCVSWTESELDGGLGSWAHDGCGSVSSGNNFTCSCNHFDSFALLLKPKTAFRWMHYTAVKSKDIVLFCGSCVLVLSLLATLVTYALSPNLREGDPAKILINLCLSLWLGEMFYLLEHLEHEKYNSHICIFLALSLHFFVFASVAWTSVEAFFIYLSTIKQFKVEYHNMLCKMCAVGWGVPLVLIVTTAASDSYKLNHNVCFITVPAKYVTFTFPVALALLVSCILYTLTVCELYRLTGTAEVIISVKFLNNLKGAVILTILLTLSWLFAFTAMDFDAIVYIYLYSVSNALQGVFIFFFYCVFTEGSPFYKNTRFSTSHKYNMSHRCDDTPTTTESTDSIPLPPEIEVVECEGDGTAV